MKNFTIHCQYKVITILNEKNKYEKTKDNLRSENETYKIMRLNSACQRY